MTSNNFRTYSPQTAASAKPNRTLPRRGNAETVTFKAYIALACGNATEAVPRETCDLAACRLQAHTDATCRPHRQLTSFAYRIQS
jgi:hypothetical protein